ncbi:MAG: asparagine synthase (glutamine-hydrolyzing) [Clostridiales bacterium]|jgi:asparagine synthase (glutamine-hydrolysing)|nr:asparagine synthase (glutamine-hydrolyzing) [Clostridiales bacterium]
MCGIAGFCGYGAEAYLARAGGVTAALKHRGPDADGVYFSENICLVHTRLAVVDIENGAQPMVFASGDSEKAIVYNGELYNTEELWRELSALGYKFKGRASSAARLPAVSDTEVLLAAYVEWGCAVLQKLNGIFAFAIWDRERGTLFAARDRCGVKPFFYCHVDGGFLFASEIKALLKHPGVRAVADEGSLAELLLLGPGRTPGCGVFKGIYELLPGQYGIFDGRGFTTRQYWSLEARRHTDSFDETVEKLRWLVPDAIKRQTVSDVPLASFLSGGLDSSAIAAISGVSGTFSVDYADNERYFTPGKFQPDSDGKYVEIMSRSLGVRHTAVTLSTEEVVNALYEAVDARDLPGMADVDSSLLLFCRRVKNSGVTVALSGECADE